MMDAFACAAVEFGFTKADAIQTVAQLFYGASCLAGSSGEDFKALAEKVTSKGGTTRAGLDVFDRERVSDIVSKTLSAAYARAGELSRTASQNKGAV